MADCCGYVGSRSITIDCDRKRPCEKCARENDSGEPAGVAAFSVKVNAPKEAGNRLCPAGRTLDKSRERRITFCHTSRRQASLGFSTNQVGTVLRMNQEGGPVSGHRTSPGKSAAIANRPKERHIGELVAHARVDWTRRQRLADHDEGRELPGV